jgi:hypothetical protein
MAESEITASQGDENGEEEMERAQEERKESQPNTPASDAKRM